MHAKQTSPLLVSFPDLGTPDYPLGPPDYPLGPGNLKNISDPSRIAILSCALGTLISFLKALVYKFSVIDVDVACPLAVIMCHRLGWRVETSTGSA